MDKFPLSIITQHPFKLFSTILATSIIVPTTYAIYLHHTLSLQIHHEAHKKPFLLSRSLPLTKTITSIPTSTFETPHLAVHDIARKTIHLSPSDISLHESCNSQDGKLITSYLRNSMQLASRLPQMYIIHFIVSPEARETFQASHLQNLSFEKGDLACGLYRVVFRTHQKVEFEMLPPPGMGDVVKGGRLVISIVPGEEEADIVISTETIMWKLEGEKGVMPLERRVQRWVHELTAWWLLDVGSEFLRAWSDRTLHSDGETEL